MKGHHVQAFVRPHVLAKAVEKLKEMKNPHYIGIDINKNFHIPEEPLDPIDTEDMIDIEDEFVKDLSTSMEVDEFAVADNEVMNHEDIEKIPFVDEEDVNLEDFEERTLVNEEQQVDDKNEVGNSEDSEESEDEEVEILGAVKEQQSNQNFNTENNYTFTLSFWIIIFTTWQYSDQLFETELADEQTQYDAYFQV